MKVFRLMVLGAVVAGPVFAQRVGAPIDNLEPSERDQWIVQGNLSEMGRQVSLAYPVRMAVVEHPAGQRVLEAYSESAFPAIPPRRFYVLKGTRPL